jgi:hypothetical protein
MASRRPAIVAAVTNIEDPPDPGYWGGRQPHFERLEYDGPRKFFLVGHLASGEPVRVQLTTASYQQLPPQK